MSLKDIAIPKGTSIHDLSDYADPDMNICKFITEYGTVGSSLVFSEAIKTSTLSDSNKDITFAMLANMQKAIKDLRIKGSCDCSKEFME